MSLPTLWWLLHYTSRGRYDAVKFLHNRHNGHPVYRPWGRNMGCWLWFLNRIHFLPLLSKCCMIEDAYKNPCWYHSINVQFRFLPIHVWFDIILVFQLFCNIVLVHLRVWHISITSPSWLRAIDTIIWIWIKIKQTFFSQENMSLDVRNRRPLARSFDPHWYVFSFALTHPHSHSHPTLTFSLTQSHSQTHSLPIFLSL